MIIEKTKLVDGIYSWKNKITKEDWINILKDNNLITETTKAVLFMFYHELNHRSTCRKLSEKHNLNPNLIFNEISLIGKAATKSLNNFTVIGPDKQPTYWVIPMYGQLNNNILEWVIRPELLAAMDELYSNNTPTYRKRTKLRKNDSNLHYLI